MAIFYTDTASFNSLSVTGSTVMSASSNATTLQLIGSGSAIFSVSGSNGGIFAITDVISSNANLFSVSTGSIDIFTVDSFKRVNISGSLTVTGSITGSLQGTASFATTASFALNAQGGGTRYLNFPVHTLTSNWSDNTTYYFGSTLLGVDTTANRNRGIFNRPGIIRSVYLYIRASATAPSTEAITIRLRTATGIATPSQVATTTFAWNGSNTQTTLNWTGLSISVSANDTFDFQLDVPAMATNPTNALLAGNLLLELTS